MTGPTGLSGSGALIPYSLRSTANIATAGSFAPLAFDSGVISTIPLLGIGVLPSTLNSPVWRVQEEEH